MINTLPSLLLLSSLKLGNASVAIEVAIVVAIENAIATALSFS